jgi:hypothetical protein
MLGRHSILEMSDLAGINMDEQDRQDGIQAPSNLRSSVNSAPLFWLKKDRFQEPNSSYPVHPCLSFNRQIAFYLMNCAQDAILCRVKFSE